MKRRVVIVDDDRVVEEVPWTEDALLAARVAVKRRLAVRYLKPSTKRQLEDAYDALRATERAVTGRTPSRVGEP